MAWMLLPTFLVALAISMPVGPLQFQASVEANLLSSNTSETIDEIVFSQADLVNSDTPKFLLQVLRRQCTAMLFIRLIALCLTNLGVMGSHGASSQCLPDVARQQQPVHSLLSCQLGH